MRNIICTMAIAMLVGCGGGGTSGGQLPLDWEPGLPGLGMVGPMPPSVDGQPSLDELKAALATEFAKLGIDPNKATSSVPSGKGIEVADLDIEYALDEDTQSMVLTLDWTERLAGDNDFNGEVNLSDLQPLVVYWEQEARYKSFSNSRGINGYPHRDPHVTVESDPDHAKNWVLGQVDSDNNGEINLADITGIATHFQQSLGGFNVYRRMAGESLFTRLPNPDDPGAPVTLFRDEAYQLGTANPLEARPQRFSLVDPDQTAGMREYYVLPTDLDGNGGGGNPYVVRYFLNDTENEPPTAKIKLNGIDYIRHFEPGSILEISPSGSRTNEFGTSIVEYAYDVDSDGVDDYILPNGAPIQITLDKAGIQLIKLRVTDNTGLMGFVDSPVFVGVDHPAVLNVQVEFSDEFVPTRAAFDSLGTHDADGISRFDFSYWHNDKPEEVFNTSNPTLVIIREPGDYTCQLTITDSFGNQTSMEKEFSLELGGFTNPSWRFSEVHENTSGVISPISIGGIPAVAFADTVDDSPGLVYKSALDQSGNEWGPGTLIDNDMYDFGVFDPQLLEIEGVPAVAYFDGNLAFGNAKYSHALAPDGSAWTEPVTLASGMFTLPALGISNGRPVIVVGGMPDGVFGTNLYSALDPLGDSWSEPQLQEGVVGVANDWVNVNGQEGFILGLDGNSLLLRQEDTNDPWEEPILLPDEFGDIFYLHAVCDGKLTFWDPGFSRIEQVQAQTADAKVWQEPTTIELSTSYQANSFDVLAKNGSPPWMCVYDYGRFELLFLQANDLQASSWGEPVVVSSLGDVGNNCQLVEVDGKPGIVYNDKSAHKLMIAIRD